ncbi:MAG: hypothetical protein JWR60_1796 [Polaromonas sp.]|nr:hypothetical protein [Polaromonas sp.]
MQKNKPPFSGPASADETEAAFYSALQNGDIEKLMACWSDEDEIVCVHPGGTRLIGPASIRSAFEALFANGIVRAQPLKVRRLQSLSASVHSVLERVEVLTGEGLVHAYVVVTNVYFLTVQGWRLVAHHAGPGTLQELPEVSEAPFVLH